MKLSAPDYRLKRNAKTLKHKAKILRRDLNIPLHAALDQIARQEGFERWSFLAAKASVATPANNLFKELRPGDLMLLGARPFQGKTLLSLELAVEAIRAGHCSVFFTFEYTQADILDRLHSISPQSSKYQTKFKFDCSNAICADYVIDTLTAAPLGTLVTIDYIQLLDHKRENQDLTTQVKALKSFAKERGLILVFLSQIDRSYDSSNKSVPDIEDVRLPNPLDLSLFNKTCFLNKDEIRYQASS